MSLALTCHEWETYDYKDIYVLTRDIIGQIRDKVKTYLSDCVIIRINRQKKGDEIVMIYQRLRDLKEDSDTNQKDIANIINMSEKQYARYERGETDIPLGKAILLANYYNVSLDYIAGRTNDKRGLTRSELSAEETELIKKYRSLSDKRQGRIIGQLELLAEEQAEETAKTREAI